MTMEVITSLITSLGFPIAVCLICFWQINKLQTEFRKQLEATAISLNNNTQVMEELIRVIGATGKDISHIERMQANFIGEEIERNDSK